MKNALFAITAATLVLGGCASGENTRDTGKVAAPGEIGSLDMKLTTPGGYVINNALYTITGSALTTPRTNNVDLTNSSQLRFQVGSLPIAAGYNIALTATATDGTPCSGNAPFAIENNQVTGLSMNLVCSRANVVETDDAGDLRVTVAVSVVDGVTCPVVTGISALPLETAVNTSLQLEGFTSSTAGATVAWTGAGGTFASPTTAATASTCGDTGGDYDLSFAVSKSGCTTNSYAVTVTCTGGGMPPVDSGVPEDSGAPVDSGSPEDSSVPVDTGTPDAGPADAGPADAGPVDAGPVDAGPVVSACQNCVRAPTSPCRDWLFSGPDNVANCFENPDPTWVERCVALYRCAVTSADSCAADPTGVTKCYCGATPIETCFTGSPAPAGACIAEVNAATGCTTPQCVEGLINSESVPSYAAYYLTLCTASPDACGPSCSLPRPASL